MKDIRIMNRPLSLEIYVKHSLFPSAINFLIQKYRTPPLYGLFLGCKAYTPCSSYFYTAWLKVAALVFIPQEQHNFAYL
jgi:ABC-type polysaccharide transport system permease subunit